MNNLEDNEVRNVPSLNKLSAFLRLLGSLIVISAAICFIAQKWRYMEPWQMCGTFLGFTVILAFVGGACRLWFKDSKGAGAFFAVAAAMVPVHFTQLGGFIMNTFGKTSEQFIRNTPKAFHWASDSSRVTILLTLAGIIILAPVIYSAFKHLIAKQANVATILYLLTNTVLLIPVRNLFFVLPTTIVLIITLFIFNRIMFKDCSIKDINVLLVRIMLFSVPILLLGRMYLIYDHTQFVIGVSLLICATTIFIAANNLCDSVPAAIAIQEISTLMAIIGWVFITRGITIPHEVLFLGLPIALIIFIAGIFAKTKIDSADVISYTIAILSIVTDLIVADKATCFTPTLSIIFAIVLLCRSFLKGEAFCIVVSLIMLGLGVVENLALIFKGNSLMPWIVLSVIGIMIIVFASLFEKKPGIFGRNNKLNNTVTDKSEFSAEEKVQEGE